MSGGKIEPLILHAQKQTVVVARALLAAELTAVNLQMDGLRERVREIEDTRHTHAKINSLSDRVDELADRIAAMEGGRA